VKSPSLFSSPLRLACSPNLYFTPKRGIKFESDATVTEVPYVVRIPHVYCHIRKACGKVAAKQLKKFEQVPSYVEGLKKPNVLLTIERPRVDSMYSGGTLYDNKQVLLLIHNKHDKLVETSVAHVKGLLNHPQTDAVERLWFNRSPLPVERKIFVDLSGEKWQTLDYYRPGGMSDDHQAFVNSRWRKQKDDWWMGVEQKIPGVNPNFKPLPRKPKAKAATKKRR